MKKFWSLGGGIIDYRFLCFDGHFEYIFVDVDTANAKGGHSTRAKRNVYDREFNLVDVRVGRDRFDPNLVKMPDNFDQMIECSERLAKPFPFVRVDLYNIDGQIVFGEMTFFHAGCTTVFDPWSFADVLGNLITLPSDQYII